MFRKCFAYEPSARVPLFLAGPARLGLARGLTVRQPVGLQDLMPTLLEAAGRPIPSSVDGRSVLPLARGEAVEWRQYLHGEHAAVYRPEQGMQYLTDVREKYVWLTQTGQEQLFDLEADPLERHDAARDPGAAERLAGWRGRLARELAGRPEGYADGERLVAGRPALTVLEGARRRF